VTTGNGVTLGELIAPRLGAVDPSRYPDEIFDLYSIPAFDRGEPDVVHGAEIGSTKQIVEPGDVLLSRIVPHIRRAWIVGSDRGRRLVASGEWIVFRNNRFDSRFLRHALVRDAFHSEFMRTVSGVGGSLLRARPAHVAKIRVPLPSLPEQQRIADILEKVDALSAKRRAALAKLDTLTPSIFLDMFGDPARNPKRWPGMQLQDVVKPGTIITYGIVQAGSEFSGGIPYIRTGDIVNGEIKMCGLRHTDPRIAAKFARSTVNAGDIVMSIRATVGTTAQVPVELNGANLTQGTARIAPGDRVEGSYLLELLRSAGIQNWINCQIKGATFREITLTRLRELPVTVPPIQLQRVFTLRVAAVRNLLKKQDSSIKETDALFASLQHRAFRGEL
jgi:type I restriction enzyme S subunit